MGRIPPVMPFAMAHHALGQSYYCHDEHQMRHLSASCCAAVMLCSGGLGVTNGGRAYMRDLVRDTRRWGGASTDGSCVCASWDEAKQGPRSGVQGQLVGVTISDGAWGQPLLSGRS
ncbi:hypothetical protein V494_02503 [Pseudogymnoascus sp. VKM F-4513 (FW-928)]|nr:hypothetical protein V494_02503 [Pseudogymnoascus sp. VKM F-4513 (FW-928)]